MTYKQWALYRYLTQWADFTHSEAIDAVTRKGRDDARQERRAA